MIVQVLVALDEAFETVATKVLLALKLEESRFMIAEFVPKLTPFRVHESAQLPSDAIALKELRVVPKLAMVAVVPPGLLLATEHSGLACTVHEQVAES